MDEECENVSKTGEIREGGTRFESVGTRSRSIPSDWVARRCGRRSPTYECPIKYYGLKMEIVCQEALQMDWNRWMVNVQLIVNHVHKYGESSMKSDIESGVLCLRSRDLAWSLRSLQVAA
ncbi:hypothetical protein AVEN_111510-1 [Araneus ventricosus]|uniref:Uncharacterized protein n=1 Tax=Araneus ventricosus TaxID=182803 RepID=A0A4Y2LDE8_ARAVE|nr:hypothetical protein AVEN_111510-1 [Araneus ventricosus]